MTVQDLTACPRANVFERDGLAPGLTARVERFLVRHRRRLIFVHAGMFVLFVALLVGPLFAPISAEGGIMAGDLRALARFLIWGLWFPLVFLSVIFTGRSWCGLLCPMGAATEWMNSIGPQRPIPRWLQWPGTPVVSFILVTIWAQTVGARDHVEATVIVFGTTLVAALLIGFLFGRNKRAWCRHVCPIGLLLGVYARIGAVEFRPKRPKQGGDAWTEATACPTMIDLDRKTESRHCIECFRCVSPKARGGLYLRLRRPGAEIANIQDHNPNLTEVLFLFLGTGSALGGFLWLVLNSYQTLRQTLGEWVIDKGWYWLGEPGPTWLMAVYPQEREVFRWFDFFLISGYMLAWTVLATAAMGGATALAAWLSARAGGKAVFRDRFVQLGYQFLPVAMISLLLGLGGDLFHLLDLILSSTGTGALKSVLFLGSVAWSLALGFMLLSRLEVPAHRRWLPMLPGGLASLAVGAAWYPAVFSG